MYYLRRKKKSPLQPQTNEGNNVTKRLKSSPNRVKKLDKVFSAFIRLRDTMPNGYFKCISCGQIKPFKDCDCGHYFSRRHMATRFHPDNAHGECSACNRFSADHLENYRRNLIRKIGQSRFDQIYVLAHSECHWTEGELQQMIDSYTEKAKYLMSEKGIKVSLS